MKRNRTALLTILACLFLCFGSAYFQPPAQAQPATVEKGRIGDCSFEIYGFGETDHCVSMGFEIHCSDHTEGWCHSTVCDWEDGTFFVDFGCNPLS